MVFPLFGFLLIALLHFEIFNLIKTLLVIIPVIMVKEVNYLIVKEIIK